MPGPDTRSSNPGAGKKIFLKKLGLHITYPTPTTAERIFIRL
jgi:hypothetical protein